MRTVRTIKLSILSLLLFGSFNARVLASECNNGSSKADIPYSFYNKDTNPPSCTCISGYGDNGTIKEKKDGSFSGTCTLIKDPTSVSSVAWVVPTVSIGVAIAAGTGYYIYKTKVAKATDIEENLPEETEMDTLGEEVQSVVNRGFEFETDDTGYIVMSEVPPEVNESEYITIDEINEIRADFNSINTPSEPQLIDNTYSLEKPINELPIESNYSTPQDTGPVTSEVSPEGDPVYAVVNKYRKEWEPQDLDEDKINLDGLGKQVKDVKENILEEDKLDEASGDKEADIDEFFDEQTTSDPNISFKTNTIIKDPAYEDINKWNKEKTLEDSDPEECG
ncbi:hypothetical protein THERMOS_2049 [Bathymodiolus thermophilus thioautotrophic gill symbiont]|uniref:Thyroglobulin type-1 domain-containing protein n=1 Tax=Bathymodiolus thermophilus thioautotrophic gill symbiont TaxID=2360 RepID=A0A8H8XDW8_9GAMM|nr:hypothetical protein THERMOS_2049 [Bathymodiolus thermophilus thioautotrophic gill symbiont]